jgi:hypothetical protein
LSQPSASRARPPVIDLMQQVYRLWRERYALRSCVNGV